MSRVPDQLMWSMVFLYPDADASRTESRQGGSGFVLAVPFVETGKPRHIYIVTNAHVARQCQVARTAHDTDPLVRIGSWYHHPDGDDVAISYLGVQGVDAPPGVSLDVNFLATPERLEQRSVGPGDAVYMIGRFIGLDRKPHNTPTVRYGSLAMGETVHVPNPSMEMHPQESIVAEMHSRSGYSGSPVFLDLDPIKWTRERAPRTGQDIIGITWGLFPHYAPILDEDRKPIEERWLVTDNSGMELIVPSWRILELLSLEEVVEERDKREKQWHAELMRNDQAVATSSDEAVFTKADSDEALRKVSRKRAPSSPEK